MVVLRAGERSGATRRDDLQARAKPRRIGGSYSIGVEARARADAAGARAAVAKMNGCAFVRMPDHRKYGASDGAAAVSQFDDIRDDLAVLAAHERRRIRRLQASSGRGTDDDGVVPRQFGDRLRQLLKPAVVGKPAVEHARIVAEHDLEAARSTCARRGFDLYGAVPRRDI